MDQKKSDENSEERTTKLQDYETLKLNIINMGRKEAGMHPISPHKHEWVRPNNQDVYLCGICQMLVSRYDLRRNPGLKEQLRIP